MKLRISVFLLLFLFVISISDSKAQVVNFVLEVTEEDLDPSVYPNQIKVTNGTLTDNGDGTASLATGGGASGWTDDGANVRLTTSTDNVGIGTTSPTNKLSITGTADISEDIEAKRSIHTPIGSQSITAASDTISSANGVIDISSDADYLMTATPTITAGTAGQWLVLRNTGDYVITLQDNADLADSDIFHGGTSGSLNPNGIMTLLYTDSNGGGWEIQSHPNVQTASGAEGITVRAGETLASALLPVYVSGYNVGLGLLEVSIADQDDSSKMPAIGVTQTAIANNRAGVIVTSGVIDGVATDSFSVEDTLWVSSTGTLVNTKPTVDDIQAMAVVARSNASNGSIMVVGAGRSNDVPRLGTMTTLTLSSGATDITTGTNEDLALMPNGSGDVGIGTTNPAIDLDVSGNIRAFSSTSQRPDITIRNTNDDGLAGRLDFEKDGASQADGDDLGVINFKGEDSTGAAVTFVQLVVESDEINDGDEAGGFCWRVFHDDGSPAGDDMFCIYGDNGTPGQGYIALNNEGKDMDTWIEAVSAPGAFFVQGSDGNVGIGTTTPGTKLDVNGIITTASNIKSEPKHLRFNIFNPNSVQSDDGEVCIWPETDAALTVTKVTITLDASANEIAGDLKYADTFIGLANPVVINVCDTTSGVLEDSSMDNAAVPIGKCVYFSFDSAPNAAITQGCFDVQYDYD